MKYPRVRKYYITGQRLVDTLNEVKGYAKGTLLDIGCGTKQYKSIFYAEVDSYIGIDVPSKIERSDKEPRLKEIDIFGDGLHLPIKNACIVTILCLQVLEHIPLPNLLFAELSRVLKKGGILILSAPQMYNFMKNHMTIIVLQSMGCSICQRKTI